MKKRIILIFLQFFLNSHVKIVGLVPVRNEESIIEICLRALSLFTDAIVVLDDCSIDNTINVIRSIKKDCNIEKIITKEKWYRDEPGDRNKLLSAGRAIGGTHFLVIDSDEIFTSNLLEDNKLRNEILKLAPGDKLCLTWINLWRSVDYFRYDNSVWSCSTADCIFCDDGKCFYKSDFIHTSRSPNNLKGKVRSLILDLDYLNSIYINSIPNLKQDKFANFKNICIKRYVIDNKASFPESEMFEKINFLSKNPDHIPGRYKHDFEYGLMHFQFVDWHYLMCKQSWYRCLEYIRNPKLDPKIINKKYCESKDEKNIKLKKCPNYWFKNYPFFNKYVYENKKSWQKDQILQWFEKYGKNYFKDLDIWDVPEFKYYGHPGLYKVHKIMSSIFGHKYL